MRTYDGRGNEGWIWLHYIGIFRVVVGTLLGASNLFFFLFIFVETRARRARFG